jgi:hypothetical protein
MIRQHQLLAVIVALVLGACTAQISGSPLNDLATNSSARDAAQFFIADLQTAAKTLDTAAANGELPKGDPASGCVHDVLQRLGIEAAPGITPPTPFVAQIDGLVSAGAVVYIRFQQGKGLLGGGASLPTECKTLVGQIVIDGAMMAKLLIR